MAEFASSSASAGVALPRDVTRYSKVIATASLAAKWWQCGTNWVGIAASQKPPWKHATAGRFRRSDWAGKNT